MNKLIFHCRVKSRRHNAYVNPAESFSRYISDFFQFNFESKFYRFKRNEPANYILSDGFIYKTRRDCVLENLENGKCLIIRYGDKDNSGVMESNFLDNRFKFCFDYQFNSNYKHKIKTFPFTYFKFTSTQEEQKFTNFECKKNIIIGRFKLKTNKIRKFLFNNRFSLNENVFLTNEKINSGDYINELNDYRYGISLPGFGDFCHRDIEIISRKCLLVRPVFKNTFFNHIEPYEHYLPIRVDSVDNFNDDVEKILKTKEHEYNRIVDNAYNWYLNNCIVGNFEKNILTKELKEYVYENFIRN